MVESYGREKCLPNGRREAKREKTGRSWGLIVSFKSMLTMT
jgi:hypothetical protein